MSGPMCGAADPDGDGPLGSDQIELAVAFHPDFTLPVPVRISRWIGDEELPSSTSIMSAIETIGLVME